MGSKTKEVNRNTTVYGYALGVFVANIAATYSTEDMMFNPDVKAIYSKILLKHKIMERKKDKNYADGVTLGTIAYRKTGNIKDGTVVANNSCMRLIDMKNEGLLDKVFGIPSEHFINLKKNGVKELTVESVRVANTFLEILNHMYDEYIAIKGKR